MLSRRTLSQEEKLANIKEIKEIEDIIDVELERDKQQNDAVREVADSRFDKIVKSITAASSVLGVILPVILYGYWIQKGFKFEETGSLTSRTFQNMQQKFKL